MSIPSAVIPSLNLIGAGRLGRTLARLWVDQHLVQMGAVVARQTEHAEAAARFIGAGQPMTNLPATLANITLIATPDDAIESIALALAPHARSGQIYVHCSGALSSAALVPLRAAGAAVASVHPLKSFASPEHAITDFTGTYCSTEGDADALARLSPIFTDIGARLFTIDPQAKTLYHAAAVLACNDLVALMEGALRAMGAAGVDRATAWEALRPLITSTLTNLDLMGTRAALTGPVARGDVATVARQTAALSQYDGSVAAIYRVLGELALQLSPLDEAQREAMQGALRGPV
ncbi:MAG: DUF2520 domain-containing protein [Burkholderiales bacterium]|nr:DUF2520 domain-containing protein [Burkholderiales bacterium]